MIVRLKVPVVALGFAEIVNVDEPEAVAGLGLKLAFTPAGSEEMLSVTELFPPIAVKLTVRELLDLRVRIPGRLTNALRYRRAS